MKPWGSGQYIRCQLKRRAVLTFFEKCRLSRTKRVSRCFGGSSGSALLGDDGGGYKAYSDFALVRRAIEVRKVTLPNGNSSHAERWRFFSKSSSSQRLRLQTQK